MGLKIFSFFVNRNPWGKAPGYSDVVGVPLTFAYANTSYDLCFFLRPDCDRDSGRHSSSPLAAGYSAEEIKKGSSFYRSHLEHATVLRSYPFTQAITRTDGTEHAEVGGASGAAAGVLTTWSPAGSWCGWCRAPCRRCR